MKKVKVDKFKANDGTLHDTEVECLKHEAETKPLSDRLIEALKNSPTIVEGAMAYRENARVAAALIEECAKICAAARVNGGGARRKRKGKTDAAPNMGETKPEGPGFTPVDTTGLRAIHERGKNDQPRHPTTDNPFPAHRAAGQIPAAEQT